MVSDTTAGMANFGRVLLDNFDYISVISKRLEKTS